MAGLPDQGSGTDRDEVRPPRRPSLQAPGCLGFRATTTTKARTWFSKPLVVVVGQQNEQYLASSSSWWGQQRTRKREQGLASCWLLGNKNNRSANNILLFCYASLQFWPIAPLLRSYTQAPRQQRANLDHQTDSSWRGRKERQQHQPSNQNLRPPNKRASSHLDSGVLSAACAAETRGGGALAITVSRLVTAARAEGDQGTDIHVHHRRRRGSTPRWPITVPTMVSLGSRRWSSNLLR